MLFVDFFVDGYDDVFLVDYCVEVQCDCDGDFYLCWNEFGCVVELFVVVVDCEFVGGGECGLF